MDIGELVGLSFDEARLHASINILTSCSYELPTLRDLLREEDDELEISILKKKIRDWKQKNKNLQEKLTLCTSVEEIAELLGKITGYVDREF